MPISRRQHLNLADYRTGTHAGSTVCFDCCARTRFKSPIALSYYGRLYRGADFTREKGQDSASAGSSSSPGENKNFSAPESRNILSPAVRFPDNAPSEVSP